MSGGASLRGGGARLTRMETIETKMGSEGVLLTPKSMTGTSIAVFTSGGDSQG